MTQTSSGSTELPSAPESARAPRLGGHSADSLERELRRIPLGDRDWKRIVRLVIRIHNARHSAKPKGVSGKTMHERESFYFAFFSDLRTQTRFRRVEPRRLRAVHVAAMAAAWQARDLAAGTIATYLSYLRTWCQWTRRAPETVRDAAYYYGEASSLAHRRQAANYDHSWVAAGVSFDNVRAAIEALCPYVAIQVEFTRLFGARPKEARCLRPHEAVIARESALPRDIDPALAATHYLRFDAGTKGGRPRDVPITTDAQRELIARAQAMVAPGEHLGRPGLSLKANTAHYYCVLAKVGVTRRMLGVTAHGLRHEFGNDAYEARAGTPSPVRGGTATDRTVDREARTRVSRLLGHNRPKVTSCYLGKPVVMRSRASESTTSRPEAESSNST